MADIPRSYNAKEELAAEALLALQAGSGVSDNGIRTNCGDVDIVNSTRRHRTHVHLRNTMTIKDLEHPFLPLRTLSLVMIALAGTQSRLERLMIQILASTLNLNVEAQRSLQSTHHSSTDL